MKRLARITPWVWLSVPLLGIVELCGHFYFRARTPELHAYEDLVPAVSELKQPDDFVTVSPPWAEPNLRWALGDERMPLRDVARPDDERYPAVVEVRLPGQASNFETWKVDTEQRVGRFRVERRINPSPEPVLFDFVDALGPEQAEVALIRANGSRKPCPFSPRAKVSNGSLGGHPTFPRQRFECGGGAWNFAGVTVIEDHNYQPRRCVWAHPVDKHDKAVRFADVGLGSRIVVHTGVPYLRDREVKGTPIDLEVLVNDRSVGTTTHRDGDGWRQTSFPTDIYAGEKHAVEFRVSSKRARKREFCFYADVR